MFLCVALGGALGALLRYGFQQATSSYQSLSSSNTTSSSSSSTSILVTLSKPFPLSTFVSNLLGCALIPWLTAATASAPHLRALLVTGFTGALTTMSSFVLDTALLLQTERSREEGQPGVAVVDRTAGREWVGVVYWVTTLLGGVGLVCAGRWAVRRTEAPGKAASNARKGGADTGEQVKAEERAEDRAEQSRVEQGASLDVPTIAMAQTALTAHVGPDRQPAYG